MKINMVEYQPVLRDMYNRKKEAGDLEAGETFDKFVQAFFEEAVNEKIGRENQ